MKKDRREVRNLILMLSSAVFVAFLTVLGLVFYFGSSGTYLLRNILIEPRTLEKISFSDRHPATGQQRGFIFNKIEFERVDKEGRGWGRFAVSLEGYATFYREISNERSLPVVTDEVVDQFRRIAPSSLIIFAQDSVKSEERKVIFQQIQLIDGGDIFRVQLHDPASSQEEWVYFRYPGIYKKAVDLFVPDAKP